MLTLNKAPHSALVGGYDLRGEFADYDLFDDDTGGFEGARGTDGWIVTGTNTIAPSTDIAHTGSKSAKITYVDDSVGAQLFFSDATDLITDLTVDKKYRNIFWTAVNGGSVLWRIYDGSGWVTVATVTSTSMVKVEYDFIAQHATDCRLSTSSMGAGEIIYIDDITLQELYTPDYSGRANHGRVNGATATPWGYSFDGANDINFGDPSDFDFGANQDFTISLRMKTSTAGLQYVCLKGSIGGAPGATTTGYGIFMGSSSQYSAEIQDDTVQVIAPSPINQHDGNWHYITAVYDRDDKLTLYKDGLFVVASDISSIGDIDNTRNLQLGSYSPPTAWFTGSVNGLWIYNQALTQREILEEMRWLSHPSSLRLVA